MNRQASFLVLFCGIQLLIVFAHIHKNSNFVKYSFLKQRNEKKRFELLEEKNALLLRLQKLKNKMTIKQEASARGMLPIRLDRIKRIDEIDDKPIQNKT